jgi:hypothetical protein
VQVAQSELKNAQSELKLAQLEEIIRNHELLPLTSSLANGLSFSHIDIEPFLGFIYFIYPTNS